MSQNFLREMTVKKRRSGKKPVARGHLPPWAHPFKNLMKKHGFFVLWEGKCPNPKIYDATHSGACLGIYRPSESVLLQDDGRTPVKSWQEVAEACAAYQTVLLSKLAATSERLFTQSPGRGTRVGRD